MTVVESAGDFEAKRKRELTRAQSLWEGTSVDKNARELEAKPEREFNEHASILTRI